MQSSHARSFAYSGSLMEASYASHMRKPAEVMLVPMIDIFTVLVTFLLMTAVFSRITILELDLPSSAAAGAPPEPSFRLEVIVRENGFELTNGSKPIAAIPKVNGEYDLKTLGELAVALKREYPQASDASVLLERRVKYDYLIQVMDAIRSAQVAAPQAATSTESQAVAAPRMTKIALFSHIAVGEAP